TGDQRQAAAVAGARCAGIHIDRANHAADISTSQNVDKAGIGTAAGTRCVQCAGANAKSGAGNREEIAGPAATTAARCGGRWRIGQRNSACGRQKLDVATQSSGCVSSAVDGGSASGSETLIGEGKNSAC